MASTEPAAVQAAPSRKASSRRPVPLQVGVGAQAWGQGKDGQYWRNQGARLSPDCWRQAAVKNWHYCGNCTPQASMQELTMVKATVGMRQSR